MKTNQAPILMKKDLSKELRWPSPLGKNRLNTLGKNNEKQYNWKKKKKWTGYLLVLVTSFSWKTNQQFIHYL